MHQYFTHWQVNAYIIIVYYDGHTIPTVRPGGGSIMFSQYFLSARTVCRFLVMKKDDCSQIQKSPLGEQCAVFSLHYNHPKQTANTCVANVLFIDILKHLLRAFLTLSSTDLLCLSQGCKLSPTECDPGASL